MPYALARETPDRLFVGVDANAAGLRELSGRAARAGLTNLLYVRAAVEDLPRELAGVADRVTVVLPWGSLLAAVASPYSSSLRNIRTLCQPRATLTVVLSLDAERDRSELERLEIPLAVLSDGSGDLARAYDVAGFELRSIRPLSAAELAAWPSTWAKRLAHGRPRGAHHLEARARE